MSLRHAVLGFLTLKPLTGYDLKKAFDGSVSNFWPADQAQIYRTLAQLTEEGLAEVRVVPREGRPDRREHSITATGLVEFDRWLRTPLDPQPTREPFLLKVFFAGRLSRDEFVAIIDERIAEGEIELDVFRDIIAGVAAAMGDDPMTIERWLPMVTLDNGIRHFLAELAWLRDLRSQALDPETNLPHAWQKLRHELLSHEGEGS